ncbi:MAG: hypothetical protein RMY64_03580 [Nostoc sp. DedQUE08]|nr:hypothetical protein [Nostoc sp. DedQUE08]
MSRTGCAFATGIYKDYSLDVTIKEEWSLGYRRYSIVDEGSVEFLYDLWYLHRECHSHSYSNFQERPLVSYCTSQHSNSNSY